MASESWAPILASSGVPLQLYLKIIGTASISIKPWTSLKTWLAKSSIASGLA